MTGNGATLRRSGADWSIQFDDRNRIFATWLSYVLPRQLVARSPQLDGTASPRRRVRAAENAAM